MGEIISFKLSYKLLYKKHWPIYLLIECLNVRSLFDVCFILLSPILLTSCLGIMEDNFLAFSLCEFVHS